MAIKTWIADDIVQGALKITPKDEDMLHVERRYQFIDEAGNVIEQVLGGRVIEDIAIAEIPADIKSALAVIDNWTYQKALEQESEVLA